ncbi:hypothetical protein WN943_014824 [Citrus x changshan-huyou]
MLQSHAMWDSGINRAFNIYIVNPRLKAMDFAKSLLNKFQL